MRLRLPYGRCAVFLLCLWLIPASAAGEEEAEPEELVEAETEEVSEEEVPQEDASEEGEPDAESVDEEQADAEEAGEEPVVGPGGRELVSDYPGTEEAMAARMDTDQIDGVDPDDEADPDEVYDLRVRELETRIDDLKERVFRSKSRIALLRETVLAENLAGSRAVITFENNLGRRFNVERALFSVDGSQVYSELEPQVGDDGVEVFSGPMTPGTHTVSVVLNLRGRGFGLFSYAEGYESQLRFSCQFTAEEGRTSLVTVRSHKGGSRFAAHEDRPDGDCQVSMVELAVEDIEEDLEDEIGGELE